jgi:hypothetical protein
MDVPSFALTNVAKLSVFEILRLGLQASVETCYCASVPNCALNMDVAKCTQGRHLVSTHCVVTVTTSVTTNASEVALVWQPCIYPPK